MIAFLRGRVLDKFPNRIILDVSGVGYEVHVPLSTYYEIGETGSDVSLRVHTHVREDTLQLFGFLTPLEQLLFERLIAISGIGPKLAVAVLSGIDSRELVVAVQRADVARLTRIPGVGKKTAERMVLELKDRVGVAAAWEAASAAHAPTPEQEQANEAVLALIALGYKQVDAHKAVHDLQQKGEAKSAEELVKLALKRIAAGK